MGPKTIAALHRFQSGCAMVKELLDETETDISEKKTDSHALKLTALASATPRKDDIHPIQARGRFQSRPERWDFGAENKINTGGSSIRLRSDKGFPGNFTANSNGPETSGSGSDF
jgi:hypothetical protein